MPLLETWLTKPLSIVQNFYDNRQKSEDRDNSQWMGECYKYFANKLQHPANQELVPFLNERHSHEVKSRSLVRFRCMVQDNFGVEYFHTLLVKDDSGNQVCGFFHEMPANVDEEPTETDCGHDMLASRDRYYCVVIPGESDWVKKHYVKRDMVPGPSGVTSGLKRTREDEDESEMMVDTHEADVSKKLKTKAAGDASERPKCHLIKNHPIPTEKGNVCILKVYSHFPDKETILPNHCYDFYGVVELSTPPQLPLDEQEISMEMIDELQTHSPPGSFAPRIHLLAMTPLHHNNPLVLHPAIGTDQALAEFKETAAENSSQIYRELIDALTMATLGDKDLAHYLLMHLVSTVSKRDVTTGLPVGKIVLNITNIAQTNPDDKTNTFPHFLARFLSQLVTKITTLDMTIDNLNKLRFIPKKNYNTNRLESGFLQLPPRTHLVIDETQLSCGKLESTGTQAVGALRSLLINHKVAYDFTFNRIEYEHLPLVVILSEHKSILPSDVQIPLKPTTTIPQDYHRYFQTCMDAIGADLDRFRTLITLASCQRIRPADSQYTLAQDDFIRVRQIKGPDSFTVEELNLSMVFLRCHVNLVAKESEGWKEVRALEERRKARLQQRR